MKVRQQRFRRLQAWLLLAYSLSTMAMFGMDRGLWWHIVMSAAACVLLVVVVLMARARLRGGCEYATGESMPRS